jgi:hypothetical protein
MTLKRPGKIRSTLVMLVNVAPSIAAGVEALSPFVYAIF